MAIDIINNSGYTDTEIKNMFAKKLNKWYNKKQ